LVVMCLAVGCAQNTEAPVEQRTAQVTPTETRQVTPTQGNTYYFMVVNGPGKDKAPDNLTPTIVTNQGGDAKTLAKLTSNSSNGDGNATNGAEADYLQSGITFNISTGSQAPAVTGTTAGTGTQSPAAYPTASPTQRIEPSVSAQLGAALPGGAVSQQSTPVAGGGTASGQGMTTTNDLKTQMNRLQAQGDDLQTMLTSLMSAWNAMFPQSPVTTQPADGGG